MILNRKRLAAWKEERGTTWTWVAKRLKVSTETFYHQLGGRCGVSLELTLELEEITGIPVRELVMEKPDKEKASA
mgnify:CR=1 FL=1